VELADTSAWTNRHKDPGVKADFDARVLAGEVATCPMVVLELLWTARSADEFGEILQDLSALPQLAIDSDVWDRAVEIWQALVDGGRHRQAKPADLLIAATAELGGVGLCHYDSDFRAIGSVTKQPVREIAPIGSL
jgi:predicted nucleic acid-binding protein